MYLFISSVSLVMTNYSQTRMWADAQRDGRLAE